MFIVAHCCNSGTTQSRYLDLILRFGWLRRVTQPPADTEMWRAARLSTFGLLCMAYPARVSECIEFMATIAQIRILADGGIRVTLDLPEDAIAEAAMLMQVRQAGEVVTVRCEAGERQQKPRNANQRGK